MGLAPQLDAPAILGSTEVIFVLRPAQPTPLTIRLGRTAAVWCRTISLAPPVAGISAVYFVAMEALERGFGLHWQARH